MIDNYLLEELVTFSKYGTLAATAEHLLVTQPTVTRGMQKLEDELKVKIFNRQPNSITLTDTGKIAVVEAKKVLNLNKNLIQTVRKFERSHQIIRIGSVAPGPLILLNHIKNDFSENTELDPDMISDGQILKNLRTNNYTLMISDNEIQTDDVESIFIGKEKLEVNLDKFTYLANKKSVKFADLKGLSFIVLNNIGTWRKVIQDNIPDAKFMYQEQPDSFSEITRYSNFPYFNTTISTLDWHQNRDNDDRVRIPISDESSTMDFFATYLKTQKKIIEPTIKQITTAWDNYLK